MKWDKKWSNFNDPFKYRWLMFCVMGAMYFFACLHRFSTTVIARDLFLEFKADATALGLMSSSYFYIYAAAQPPVGILSDTLGPRRVLTIFALIACIGSIIFGIAPSMTMATIGRALIGFGVGGAFVPALKSFSKWYKEREFAGVTGFFLAIGNAGTLAASLPLTYLVLHLGWRMSFLSMGAVSFFLAIICWATLQDKPEEKAWRPIEVEENPLSLGLQNVPEDITIRKRLGIVFINPSFWMLTISYFFFGGPGLTFQGLWAVPYLMDVYAYSRIQAGELLIIISLGFIIGASTIGFLANRVALDRKVFLLFSLGLGLGSWAIFFLSGGKPNSVFIIPLFLITGFARGASGPLYMTIGKELFSPSLIGTAVGLMNPAPFISTALFQPFTGFLMDAVGCYNSVYPLQAYYRVFAFFFICMIIAVLIIIPLSFQKMRPPDIS